MIHRIYREWRKVFRLSATFLLAFLVVVACKKKTTTIGSAGIDPTGLLAAGAVEFSVETYTILDDSISTKNPGLNVLGEMDDPVFGKIKTSFYTQLRLNSVSPDFGDMNSIKIDSSVLAMQFFDYTGKLTPQTFEVYESLELIDTTSTVKYYDFDDLMTNTSVNLVATGMGTITPEPIADALIDTVSVAPQLRIQLDTNFARTLMKEAVDNPSTYTSNDNFLNYFMGLHIKTNNAFIGSGQGGVFSFNMNNGASKMTIYYQRLETINGTPTWVKKSYDYVINSSSQSFNRIDEYTRSMEVQNAIDNQSAGQTKFYAQAFGTRAVVEIPDLGNLPSNAIIQKAVLNLPIEYQTGSAYATGTTVTFFEKENATSSLAKLLFPTETAGVLVSDFSKSVQKDISGFVQEIVSGSEVNRPIYIAPSRSNNSANRIVFNGPNTLNKVKPKLYIIYTEF